MHPEVCVMRVGLALILLFVISLSVGLAGDNTPKKDARLGPPRHYDLKYFPWTPPTTREAWEAEKQRVREKILVSNGLWPLPAKTLLNPVIHGKIERDGYTIEKVFFASYPGHYVSGNLYRPTGKTGRLPAILSPHGHWANGRLYDAGEKAIEAELKSGAEKTREGARYPLQARCAQLARMGCVAFHYDMVGVADSQPIAHRAGFVDVDAELRLQNFMGLQTWNSIRALDFVIGLPDVDPGRIGVTGASGGGTQTFILCAIDDRPAAAFPAVMVGTAMQGGCICENASYLRVDGNNVQIAACFAPKPLGMSGAMDWTKDIMTKGLPELKQLYGLYGVPDNVMAEAHLEFGHNYNQVSREIMYNFFNKHLKLGHKEPIAEQPFVPVPPKELSVYDAEHPRPKDASNAEALRRYLTDASDKQMQAIVPKDKASLKQFRDVIEPAIRVMMLDSLPAASEVEEFAAPGADVVRADKAVWLSRKGKGEKAFAIVFLKNRENWNGRMVVWVADRQHGEVILNAARKLIDDNSALCIVEPFRTDAAARAAKAPPVNKTFAGYTFGYNRPVVAERVHDILTAVAWAKKQKGVKSVDLVGCLEAGPWVALARGLCGDTVRRTAADLNGFRFEQVKDMNDAMMLPGALKYGGLMALSALSAPHELLVYNTKGCGPATYLTAAYEAAGASDKLQRREETMEPAAVVDWLLR
jgi:dienelactone hydrolase